MLIGFLSEIFDESGVRIIDLGTKWYLITVCWPLGTDKFTHVACYLLIFVCLCFFF